ncbi:MAG TPA: hypothetical protein VJK25_00270, partial [Patescibacteria group bacterium]|nr:hypothetical protein [Patescibacteria group bacterium]
MKNSKEEKDIKKIEDDTFYLVDQEKIIKTYVEVVIFDQLLNNNSQIVYGRRGTGKTHILKYLQSE